MNERPLKEDIFDILRILSTNNALTQRDLSIHLSFSLGKTNYLLRALAQKGLLEIKNFTTKDKKVQKVKYLLTKEGLETKARLTYHFLKQKEVEYSSIKKEWEELEQNNLLISNGVEYQKSLSEGHKQNSHE